MSNHQFVESAKKKSDRYLEVQQKLLEPDVASNPEALKNLGKELRELEPIHTLFQQYNRTAQQLAQGQALLNDPASDKDLKQMALEEVAQLEPEIERFMQSFEELLIKVDPELNKNVIIEIRAGTGGVEASLFAQEVYRMYVRYAQSKGFKIETLGEQLTEQGGIREVIFLVNGEGAYGRFKYESGVHRVQRVPQTEASGRIHTSAITVAVMPEAEEVEIDIKPEEIRVDVFRSGGPGGQSVNTTDSAVRITHLPTGLLVKCQDEKSQLKNKQKAMKILRSRLLELKKEQQESEARQTRKAQVGSGDRSEKIRTYNFHENRVTDHRIGLTLHKLDSILEGDLDEVVDALHNKAREEQHL